MSDEGFELADVVGSLHDNYMIKVSQEDSEKRGYKKFHPSSFGGCPRLICLQYYSDIDPKFKPPEEVFCDPRRQRIFSAGHAFHNRMQDEFARMRILRGRWLCKSCGKIYGKEKKTGVLLPDTCECQKVVKHKRYDRDLFKYLELEVDSEEYNFHGHCDGVIEIDLDDEHDLYVVDFKTINQDSFKFLNKPDPKYVVQIQIYMWLLDIPCGIIYYEEKNRHERKEFRVERSEIAIDQIKKNSKTLQKLLKNKQVPPIKSDYKKDRSPCRYCDYKKVCWSLNKKKG